MGGRSCECKLSSLLRLRGKKGHTPSQPHPWLVARRTRRGRPWPCFRCITCVVLFVLGDLGLGRRQHGLGGLQLRGGELQHPRAGLVGTEGVVGVLSRAVQDEAPLLQFSWKTPRSRSPTRQEAARGKLLRSMDTWAWTEASGTHGGARQCPSPLSRQCLVPGDQGLLSRSRSPPRSPCSLPPWPLPL